MRAGKLKACSVEILGREINSEAVGSLTQAKVVWAHSRYLLKGNSLLLRERLIFEWTTTFI
jgi:hypothetical protein